MHCPVSCQGLAPGTMTPASVSPPAVMAQLRGPWEEAELLGCWGSSPLGQQLKSWGTPASPLPSSFPPLPTAFWKVHLHCCSLVALETRSPWRRRREGGVGAEGGAAWAGTPWAL